MFCSYRCLLDCSSRLVMPHLSNLEIIRFFVRPSLIQALKELNCCYFFSLLWYFVYRLVYCQCMKTIIFKQHYIIIIFFQHMIRTILWRLLVINNILENTVLIPNSAYVMSLLEMVIPSFYVSYTQLFLHTLINFFTSNFTWIHVDYYRQIKVLLLFVFRQCQLQPRFYSNGNMRTDSI